MKKIAIVLALMLLLTGCGAKGPESRTLFAMDTVMDISVWGKEKTAAADALESLIPDSSACTSENAARIYRDKVLPCMDAVREAADALEGLCAEGDWPFPNYTQLLFGVN